MESNHHQLISTALFETAALTEPSWRRPDSDSRPPVTTSSSISTIASARRRRSKLTLPDALKLESSTSPGSPTGATDRHTAPATMARRIEQLTAKLRAKQRQTEGHAGTTSAAVGTGSRSRRHHRSAAGPHLAEVKELTQGLAGQLTYWSTLRNEQIAAGQATSYGPRS